MGLAEQPLAQLRRPSADWRVPDNVSTPWVLLHQHRSPPRLIAPGRALSSMTAVLGSRPLSSASPSRLPNVPFEQLQSSDEPLLTWCA